MQIPVIHSNILSISYSWHESRYNNSFLLIFYLKHLVYFYAEMYDKK